MATQYRFHPCCEFSGAERLDDIVICTEFQANDPIDEFLSQALYYQRAHTPSLEGFLHWLESSEAEVRRDMEFGRDEVRILTEINAVCDLCDIARAEAPGPEERCYHCHFYQQFGGCQEVSWKMTERVTEPNNALSEASDEEAPF